MTVLPSVKVGAMTGCSQLYLVSAVSSGLGNYFGRDEGILTAHTSAQCLLMSLHLPPPLLCPILGPLCTLLGRFVEVWSLVVQYILWARHLGTGDTVVFSLAENPC